MTTHPPLLPEPWIVCEVIRESDDVVTLVIEPGDGAAPMSFKPGQFNMLYAFGMGEVPISISGDPTDSSRIMHTIRDVGMITSALCELKPGDLVGVRGPYGSQWPIVEETGRDILVAAGGIGLAPLRPLLYHVLAHRDAYDDVMLLYGARKPDELLFAEEYEAWRAARIQVECTLDNADAAWTGRVGVVTSLIRNGKFKPDKASAFTCGPEIMMRFTIQELENKGIAANRIFLSLERNMKCAVALCGHCQLGPELICRDGPVFTWPRMRRLMTIREL